MAATGPQEVSTAAITTSGKPGITAINSNTNKEQNYKLYYIGESKSAVVLPVDNQTPPKPIIGGKPIYTSGVWDTTQFSGIESSDQAAIHSKIQTEIRNHTTTTKQDVPQWASVDNQGFDVTSTQTQVAADTEDNKAGGFFQFIPDAWNWTKNATSNFIEGSQRNLDLGIQVWTDGPAALVFNAGVQGGGYDNANDILFKKVITYPSDLSSQQDVMKIDCYSYQPPYEASMAQSFGKSNGSNLGLGLSRQSPYRKKLGAGIILPVPNNVSDANSTSWVDDNMSTLSMGAAQHVNATFKGKTATLAAGMMFGQGGMRLAEGFNRLTGHAALWGNIGTKQAGQGELGANLISQLTGKLGYDITPETILSRAGGVIANANTELMFSGVKLRQFGFQWRMTPRDEMEAHQIRMIIRAFKQWSAPKKIIKLHSGDNEKATAGAPSYFLGTPNIFRLRYLTSGGRNILGLNKFKPCALTSIQVQYTPDGQWNAYEGGQPISVIMDLRFAELEPIYNTDYSGNNIAENRAFDSNDPNSLGDLMPISIIQQNNPASSDVGY